MLSLCVVNRAALLFAYISWLQDQLTELWADKLAVRRVSDAHVALLKRYGATATPTGKQYNVELHTLASREEQFVSDLLELITLIEKTVPRTA